MSASVCDGFDVNFLMKNIFLSHDKRIVNSEDSQYFHLLCQLRWQVVYPHIPWESQYTLYLKYSSYLASGKYS